MRATTIPLAALMAILLAACGGGAVEAPALDLSPEVPTFVFFYTDT